MKNTSKKPFVSILTPTYNRAHTLRRLFDSLQSQTDNDFEWIVIDDGSIDDTSELIKSFQKDNPKFNIVYKKKSNGGMHTAVNAGFEVARGKMIFLLGSDDMLKSNAIETIKIKEESIAGKNGFAGIAFSLVDENGCDIGARPIGEYLDASTLELKKNGLSGDKMQVYYSDIICTYRYPEFEGEKFMEMAYVFFQIANKGYNLRWFNEAIYVAEYSEGGMTTAGDGRFKGSPQGMALYTSFLLKNNTNYLKGCLIQSLYARQLYDYKNLRQASAELEGGSLVQMYIGVGIRKLLGR